MSTNFYWLLNPKTLKPLPKNICKANPNIHIGKRLCAGMGTTRFIWTSLAHKERLKELGYLVVCENEYGDRFTGRDALKECECDYESVDGSEFS